MSNELNKTDLLVLTADIVAAHVSNNNVSLEDLPQVIQQVYYGLTSVGSATTALRGPRPEPVVPIKKSVTEDYIICLEDGKKLKMLKRHLRSAYNMSVDEYRERWGLASDYPVVAPNYAKQRSALAKTIGLGKKPAINKLAANS